MGRETEEGMVRRMGMYRRLGRAGRARAATNALIGEAPLLASLPVAGAGVPPIAHAPASVEVNRPSRSLYNRVLGIFVSGRMSTHLAGLDTIRGLAVFFVLMVHALGFFGGPRVEVPIPFTGFALPWSMMVSRMGVGVDLFFVLSGFLLALPWHKAEVQGKPHPRLRPYLQRRLWRIVPPYWFMLVLMLLLLTNTLIPWSTVASRDGLKSLFAFFFFMQQLFPFSANAQAFANVNGAMWTLTIEMIFYLTLPWFVLAFTKRRWMWGLPLSLAISMVYLVIVRHPPAAVVSAVLSQAPNHQMPSYAMDWYLADQFPAFLPEFGIGMAVANWWANKDTISHPRLRAFISPRAGALYAVGGAGLMLFVLLHPTTWMDYDYFGMRLSAAAATGLLILGSLYGTSIIQSVYRFLPLRLYGVMGYSIFLWHMPILHIIDRYPVITSHHDPVLGYLRSLVIAIPVVTLIGAVLFFAIEKPLIERRPGSGDSAAGRG